ncbi:MAG: hypothetical protein V2A67_03620 [Bacteroidota bacterium]
MRPGFFLFIPIVFAAHAGVTGQDAVLFLLREPAWNNQSDLSGKRLQWTGFIRQYFCTAGWNASGIGVSYHAGQGESSALIMRDGIPGFSWYHLYLSHRQQIEQLNTRIQLRFSGILTAGQRPVFRLGANLAMGIPVGEATRIDIGVWDAPGLLFPRAAPARGDPMIRLQATHSPGRLLDLLWALDLSPARPGPLYMGIRMKINEQLRISGLIRILQPGFTLGISWSLHGMHLNFLMDEGSGVGMTPTIVAGGGMGKG